jgi:hypothetical protein
VSKKLGAVLALLIVAGTVAYLRFRNRPESALSPEEKTQLLHGLAFRNQEVEKRLSQTKYFSDLSEARKPAKKVFVDFNETANLWSRACADKSFDEVKRALGDGLRKATSVLSAAEKSQLFFDLTFHNDELRERLRLTRYFSGSVPVKEKGSGLSVDADTSYYLWRRACADQSFAEVKQVLGVRYHFVPPSYYFDSQ